MHSSGKTPLIRLAKRDGMAGAGQWGIRIAAILLALVVGGLVILLSGNNPIQGYAIIVEGALGKTSGIRQTVKNFIPLLGTALAIAPCFKMRFWNIGAEGQITAGAMCATYFALFWADSIPQVPLLLLMCAAGAIGGGLWALVPAFFKARWGTNETLFTLMMNYIIIGVVKWLQGGPWEKIPRGSQQIEQFASNACLPRVAGVYCGWIVVLALTVFMFLYMKYTKHGYEIAVIGESENTARYAGKRGLGHYAHHVPLRRHRWRGGLPAGLRRQQHPVLRRSRRGGLHRHHRGLAGPAQPLRHGGHIRPAGRPPEGRGHPQHPDGYPRVPLRRHHRRAPLLHAGVRVLHQL